MSDEHPEDSAEPQRETPEEPDMTTSSTTVAPEPEAGRLVTAFVWVMRYGLHLTVAAVLLLVGLVLVLGIDVPRSLQIIGLTAGVSGALVGRWVGVQAVDLMGGPQMLWLVDLDLLDRDGAGIYACPTPRWSEWTVVDGQLWWATPNLAFGRGVDLDAREVAGTWVGSTPDPILARALEYLRYNRKQLEPKARKGEALEINAFSIVRSAAVKTVKHVVRTFEKGSLPDDGKALHSEIDSVLEDFDLDSSDEIFDEDPTQWTPGDDSPAPDPLADLAQQQQSKNGDSQ